MQARGDQFLAGASLGDHQHRSVEWRDPGHVFEDFEESRRLPDQLLFLLVAQLAPLGV
jgi:hypothetical protein